MRPARGAPRDERNARTEYEAGLFAPDLNYNTCILHMFMFMFMYVCMYVCIYIYIYRERERDIEREMYIYIYICIDMYMYMYVYMYVYIYIYTYVYVSKLGKRRHAYPIPNITNYVLWHPPKVASPEKGVLGARL